VIGPRRVRLKRSALCFAGFDFTARSRGVTLLVEHGHQLQKSWRRRAAGLFRGQIAAYQYVTWTPQLVRLCTPYSGTQVLQLFSPAPDVTAWSDASNSAISTHSGRGSRSRGNRPAQQLQMCSASPPVVFAAHVVVRICAALPPPTRGPVPPKEPPSQGTGCR